MGIRIEEARAGDVKMSYFCFGEGKRNFVILPGLSIISVMLSADAIADAYAAFGRDYKVWVFDRRSDLPEEYKISDMAKDTAEIMKKLGIEDACIFGTSQGGMIAQLIAERYPELVHCLLLGSTVSRIGEIGTESVLGRWIALAEEGKTHELNASFSEYVYSPETVLQFKEVFAAMEKSITGEDMKRFLILAKGTEYFNAYDGLAQITCPVLILGSEKDRVLDVENMKKTAEILGCDIYLYPDFSHAVFDEAPDYKSRLLSFAENTF